MKNDNDFINSIKVSDFKTKPQHFINKEQYTCIKVMRDADKIVDFLRNFEKQQEYEKKYDESHKLELDNDQSNIDEQNSENNPIDINAPISYYYSISFELSHANTDLLDGKINEREFTNKSDEIYQKYKIDFDYLIDTIDEIDKYNSRIPNKISKELLISLQKKAIEYFNSRNEDKTNEL